jgi:hypothetical protein
MEARDRRGRVALQGHVQVLSRRGLQARCPGGIHLGNSAACYKMSNRPSHQLEFHSNCSRSFSVDLG